MGDFEKPNFFVPDKIWSQATGTALDDFLFNGVSLSATLATSWSIKCTFLLKMDSFHIEMSLAAQLIEIRKNRLQI